MTYLFSFVDQTGIKCQHFLQQFGFISEVFAEPIHCWSLNRIITRIYLALIILLKS